MFNIKQFFATVPDGGVTELQKGTNHELREGV
jgi:hypothetical protein